jgi:hypothetical protein
MTNEIHKNTGEDIPQPYAISFEEFSTPYTGSIEENPLLTRVTRNNFTPTIIRTFALSRGDVVLQFEMFEWMRINEGFDFEQTFTNFHRAGNFQSLNPDEKKLFLDAIKRIPAHKKNNISPAKDLEETVLFLMKPEKSEQLPNPREGNEEFYRSLKGLTWEQAYKRLLYDER